MIRQIIFSTSIYRFGLLCGVMIFLIIDAHTQVNTNCNDASSTQTYSATAFFNYGAASDLYNSDKKAAITIGQTATQLGMFSQSYKSELGFYGQFLLPPLPPYVQASEGNLGDRVEIIWNVSALSPVVTDVFKVYRNGTFLDEVENDERVYVDYNVVAGEFYTYTIRGVNKAGIGKPGSSVGFLNPNGTITGQIKTVSGNPVQDCSVDLTPTLGRSLLFNGDGVGFSDYNTLFDTSRFTVAFWVKQDSLNDNAGLIDLGSSIDKNWWLHTPPSGSGRGVVVQLGGNGDSLEYIFPAPDATDWHHIAATFSGSNLLLYVDGELKGSQAVTIQTDSIPLYFGGKTEDSGYFKGNLDEILVFNRQLPQTEIQRNINKSISSKTNGLIAYWKMDEGTGSKTYDLTQNENRMYMCGPSWSGVKAPVTSSSLTDVEGYYIIEGINYGTGQTFTVRPSKKIYKDVSLEFNASDQKWAELTNFDLPDSSVINVSFNVFDLNGNQVILAKDGHMDLRLINGDLNLDIEGTNVVLESLGIGWHNIMFLVNQDGSSASVDYYRNGIFKSTHSYTISQSDWSLNGINWTLGADDPVSPEDYFTGLVDEVIVYQGPMDLGTIQTINNIGTGPGNSKIVTSFSLNESQGDSLYNLGITGGTGVLRGANWANTSRIVNTTEHEFLPSSKAVTLNKTNTSTDQVDFVDLSTIPVSGFVRYDKTDCFADGVEILIDGFSASPPIFTDADGRFTAEFEPGSTAKLFPSYNGHTFSPAFYEVRNANSPVAGVLFLDKTTRKVSGQLVGGGCRKSIIGSGETAKVILYTINGCYEKIIDITASDGNYEFTDVPPFKCNVGILDHDDTDVFDYLFNTVGASTIDLTLKNDTVDFVYYSSPVVTLSPIGEEICGNSVLNQNNNYSTIISVHQEYSGGDCPVDSAKLVIDNGLIQDVVITESFEIGQNFEYVFAAGPPNIVSPYTKTLQVTAIADGESTDLISEYVILGRRPRNVNFTSTSPSIPFMILHDPPGDQSYSSLENGERFCTNFSVGVSNSMGEEMDGVISLGPDVSISAGSSFVSIENAVNVTADLSMVSSLRTTSTVSQTGEFCNELLTKYTTDQDEILLGDTSDLYIGGALNMLFGVTDILKLDTANMNCFALDTGVNVLPGSFATNFFYTEYHINKNIIPNLLTIGDITSAERWQNIIDQNNINKANAIFSENISFGSGVNIEKSTTESSTSQNSIAFDVEVDEVTGEALGILVNGIGGALKLSTSISIGGSSETGTSTLEETTFKYNLADNDPGDIFTVDVKKDPVYGSTVFTTISGASSCPYEENTVPRDEVNLVVDKFVANNVRENDAASFIFNLGNESQTEEFRNYVFSLRPASNVNGAQVKINGADPDATEFQIEPFKSIPVTVTVERGPTAFSDTLTFDFVAQCEDDKNIALGIPKSNTPFTKSITVVVNFIEPCSSVDINNPLQDWVQTPADGLLRSIRLIDYDTNDLDLDLMRVQYRRSQGNGVWVNIMDIPKDSLGAAFENLDWNTDGLADGLYEIRALAVCIGGLDVGISHVIKGRIERTPPELFGTAEPADGVLSKGDEISITFNEPIQCTSVLLAAGIGANIDNNNLGLYDTQTGALIDFVMSCSEDKIILVPNVATKFLENKVLRVEMDSILDLAGNKSGHLEWEFVVDQNSANWLDREDVVVVKQEEDFVHVERRIENRGGFSIDWELQNIPEWCSIYPTAGQLAPGDVRIINFAFDETMEFGKQLDTLILHGPEGDEPMIIDARVVCPPPNWEINASDWEYAMNFVAELDIEGVISQDEEDILGAFIDGELRGSANVEYFPAIDKYLVFLTVYSNDIAPLSVDMRVWDASSCLLFSPILESFVFESDDLIGTPLAPQVIHTNNLVLKEILVHPGWNWLSFNLELLKPSPDTVLQDIDDPIDAVIKSQTEFAQYANGFGWFGSLDSIGNISAYQLRANDYDTIVMVGNLIDPDSIEIPLAVGWNWISFIPRSPMAINEAMTSVSSLDGDVIKSQTLFSQYVSGFGWIGTLKNLRPDEGYIIKTSIQDTLKYPDIAFDLTGNQEGLAFKIVLPEGWDVNPPEFEHSMTSTSIVISDDENIVEENWMLGAFVGDECRGNIEAIWVAPIDAYMFFLTTYANASGELFSFKLYDGNDVFEANEKQYFSIDAQIGEIEAPFEFTLPTTSIVDGGNVPNPYLRIDPNPIVIGEDLQLSFSTGSSDDATIQIYDINGSSVFRSVIESSQGINTLMISTQQLTPGMYNVSLLSKNDVINKKLLIIK